MKKNDRSSSPSSSSLRPSLVLPPRAAVSGGLFGGGAASPGPMTLVSNFFSDNNSDRFSFSQLLSGAISADDDSSDLRFNVSERSEIFTVPPDMSQGPLGAPIQQKLAYVSVEANSHFQYPTELQRDPPLYFNPTTHQQVPKDNMKKESSNLSYSDQRSSIVVDKPADDGYNWRKYGQKQVKGSEFPRSYYKCTQTKCPVKKKVERSVDGQITEIIYKGQHNHQPPQLSKRGKDLDNYEFSNDGQNGNLNRTREREINSENFSGSVGSEDEGEDESKNDEANEDEPDAKRRNSHVRAADPAASHRTVTEPRIIVQTTSEVDLLDDGYRWRKYGQKIVKGNPYPRSYYKCTSQACNVRKHVERAASDPKAVITTYEGKHNHDVPAARNSSHNMANNNVLQSRQQNAISDKHHSLVRNNDPQQITLLRFKEELT